MIQNQGNAHFYNKFFYAVFEVDYILHLSGLTLVSFLVHVCLGNLYLLTQLEEFIRYYFTKLNNAFLLWV